MEGHVYALHNFRQTGRMSALTETEIFDCLITNFKLAAEHCDDLAKRPISGPAYLSLRDELALIEGAMQQASFWRGDHRWLEISRMIPEAHRLAGEWLRGVEVETDTPGLIVRRPIPAGELHPMFVKLAEFLRWAAVQAQEIKNAKTNKLGDLAYVAPRAPRNVSRQGWEPRASGLVIPAGAA